MGPSHWSLSTTGTSGPHHSPTPRATHTNKEDRVRRQIAIAAALATTLVAAAACSSDNKTTDSGSLDGSGKTITVWLMVDAQTSWKDVVDAASKKFTDETKA